jgi:hypothetical protein
VRPAVFLVLFAGCSSLLGIENPRASDDGGPRTPDHLAFSLTDFKLAQLQTVRLHVQAVFADGAMEDATATATYSSDDPAIATIGGPGLVNGSQAGTTTITARLGSATPATVNATVTTTRCHPVINELATGSATSPADEYVEVYNGCTVTNDVDTWTLVYRSATATTADSTGMVTLAGQMAPGEIRLFAGVGFRGVNDGVWPGATGILQQNNGAVGLRAGPVDVGTLVDSIAYGAVTVGHPFIETNPTAAMVNGRSASRLPFDGNDNGDGAADFMLVPTQTPRALNAP